MKILRKIIEAIVPVSKQDMVEMANALDESKRDMTEMVNVIDGLRVANGQQAEMLANLVNQISGMQMKKAEKQVKEDEKIKYDEAFQ